MPGNASLKNSSMFHTDSIDINLKKFNLTTISGVSDCVGKWSSSAGKVKYIHTHTHTHTQLCILHKGHCAGMCMLAFLS